MVWLEKKSVPGNLTVTAGESEGSSSGSGSENAEADTSFDYIHEGSEDQAIV